MGTIADDETVILGWREHDIELRDEPTYSPGSADNLQSYGHEVALSGVHGHVSSRHGVTVRHREREIASCIVLATGGGTTVHRRSAVVHGNGLYLAVGNRVCALELLSLRLNWHLEADVATCFGLVAVPGHAGLISHGELEIVRLAFDGTVLWRQGGRDIFTGKLTVDTTGVEVADWNGDRYWFDLATGEPRQREA